MLNYVHMKLLKSLFTIGKTAKLWLDIVQESYYPHVPEVMRYHMYSNT